MAQVFVNRQSLLDETPTAPVLVIASYRNETVIDRNWHGTDSTVVGVSDVLVVEDRDNYRTILRSDWRDDYVPVVNAEANRRITTAFPAFKQSNYNAQWNTYQVQYGLDPATWPAGPPQDFAAEYNRGWKYINDVRAASNAMTAMPQDPTADEHWPTVITPVA